ncbi:hypothetical protein KGF54_001593 [Candida jiufengensis]|uniref:uncharacterized protein n=1 Tax=Candida jiufengensis TaxID=497108 RepID=UPI0022244FDD|nr:uncharacterized protein KGF54_001593 [Candida jiufengensis]KAI5955032.1 hypothetical protein KGF54_001593 [Candida jiufengensis]
MTIKTYKDHEELTDDEFKKLKESVMNVGCTILTKCGKFIKGANVENASYGAGVCAERTTISKAITDGYKDFKAIAISGDTENPIVPCGICRQFIREFNKNIVIFLFNKEGEFIKVYLNELLPLSFGPEDLGINTN